MTNNWTVLPESAGRAPYRNLTMNPLKQLSAKSGLICAVALGLVWANATASAQTFTTIKNFGSGILTNIAGLYPYSRLVQGSDDTLYGTASRGEGDVRGTVFKVQPDGGGFTVLKWFTKRVEGEGPG